MNLNIYSCDKYIEDRPLGDCESCKRRYKQRLNALQYENGIISYVCDKCIEVEK